MSLLFFSLKDYLLGFCRIFICVVANVLGTVRPVRTQERSRIHEVPRKQGYAAGSQPAGQGKSQGKFMVCRLPMGTKGPSDRRTGTVISDHKLPMIKERLGISLYTTRSTRHVVNSLTEKKC